MFFLTSKKKILKIYGFRKERKLKFHEEKN